MPPVDPVNVEIPVSELTEIKLDGVGVFDALMRTAKVHLDAEFKESRIRGPEYSQVYLGLFNSCMSTAMEFLALKKKVTLEVDILQAQLCLLQSQYDASRAQVLKTESETDLMKQKIITEKAQTMELGVDDNSVVGKQKKLYEAQTKGFSSDAKQKAAKLVTDTWSTRRMTDDGTSANTVNKLDDATVGRVMEALLTDIGA